MIHVIIMLMDNNHIAATTFALKQTDIDGAENNYIHSSINNFFFMLMRIIEDLSFSLFYSRSSLLLPFSFHNTFSENIRAIIAESKHTHTNINTRARVLIRRSYRGVI